MNQVTSHTESTSPPGKCSTCGITTLREFLECRRHDECDFVLDKQITVPVREAVSDEQEISR